MFDNLECPYCGEEQDQSEARPWHNLADQDTVDHECDGCGKTITIHAQLCYGAEEKEAD
jgi:predicted RNA-binding Zn-ribbon protein involved in translation (DUF1610 family)